MLVEFERFNRVVEKGKYEESYMFKVDNERIYRHAVLHYHLSRQVSVFQ